MLCHPIWIQRGASTTTFPPPNSGDRRSARMELGDVTRAAAGPPSQRPTVRLTIIYYYNSIATSLQTHTPYYNDKPYRARGVVWVCVCVCVRARRDDIDARSPWPPPLQIDKIKTHTHYRGPPTITTNPLAHNKPSSTITPFTIIYIYIIYVCNIYKRINTPSLFHRYMLCHIDVNTFFPLGKSFFFDLSHILLTTTLPPQTTRSNIGISNT